MKQLEEVARMQQLAGILTEIKINNPIKVTIEDGNYYDYDLVFHSDNKKIEIISYNNEGVRRSPSKKLKGNKIYFTDTIEDTEDYHTKIELLKKYSIPFILRKNKTDNEIIIDMDLSKIENNSF